MNRRGFLTGLTACGAASAFSFVPRLSHAGAECTQRRFVFIYFPGGWDQLLFLDPRRFEEEAADASAYRREVERTGIDTAYQYGGSSNNLTQQYGGQVHTVAGADPDFTFGPATVRMDGGEPTELNLKVLAEEGVPMSIVRGINMGTLGHEPGYLYFLTGEPAVGSSARGTSIPIRIAEQLGAIDPELAGTLLSTVALSVSSYSGDAPGRYAALGAQSVDDLQRILERPAHLVESSDVEDALAAFAAMPRSRAAERLNAQGLLDAVAEANQGVRAMLEDSLAASFRYLDESSDEANAVRDFYRLHHRREGGARRSALVNAAFVSQCIKKGLAQFISVAFPAGGDTHGSGNQSHARGMHTAIDALARLIHDLRSSPSDSLGGSWLDHTTICVFSEFSRTPLFNAQGGRDHHFTNSCLLIGAGVSAGRVVGASSQTGGMIPEPFDFDAQELSASGRAIVPEDIAATMLASAELDYSVMREGKPLWNALTVSPY